MNKLRLFLASDSTCQDYDASATRQAGWGMFLGEHLSDRVQVINRAIGGRSSKSFIAEGRLAAIREELQSGDWLLIQMGHNDSTREKPERFTEPEREFKGYLRQYVAAAREKGAFPLLITPVARLHQDGDGSFVNDFPDYCRSVAELAAEEKVPMVDLMARSLAHWESVGYDEVFGYFMVSVNGTDHTHFTDTGARVVAGLLVEGIRELGVPIAR